MATWSSGYECTDCGKEISSPGTCADCLIKNQPVPQQRDKDNKGRRKEDKVKRRG
jgi:DNA-directed RNA polymerase subunit RPC12/RpoP